jgi:hypothetical protein
MLLVSVCSVVVVGTMLYEAVLGGVPWEMAPVVSWISRYILRSARGPWWKPMGWGMRRNLNHKVK